MSIWNRNNDPHNSEELMIAEYYRRVDEVEELRQELKGEQDARDQERIELYDLLDESDAKYTELEKRLQDVIDKSTGVLDLCTPTVAYYLDVCSSYAIKHYAEEHEVDIVDEEYGDIQVLENLIALDDEILWEFATNTVAQYSSTFIKCEKREFPYVLQITWMQDKPLKMLYDPYYQKDRLYTYSTEVRDNTWIVAEDLSKIKPYALKKLRGLFEEAMHQLRVEHEKPIDEN